MEVFSNARETYLTYRLNSMKHFLILSLLFLSFCIPAASFAALGSTDAPNPFRPPGASNTLPATPATNAEAAPATQGAGDGTLSAFMPIVPIPGITATMTFPQYVNRMFTIVIQLGAILAVIMIVYGGFEYMTSAVAGEKKDGSKKIRNAVTGLILLLASYLILFIINPCLVEITAFSGENSTCSPPPQQSALTAEQQRAARENANPDDPFANGDVDANGRKRAVLPRGMCLPEATRPILPCSGAIPVCKFNNTEFFEKGATGCLAGETETVFCPYGCDERRVITSLLTPPEGYEVGGNAAIAGMCEPESTNSALVGTYKAYCCKSDRTNCVEKNNVTTSCETGREQVSVCVRPQ